MMALLHAESEQMTSYGHERRSASTADKLDKRLETPPLA
jgi:hypothetical protein